MTVDSISQPVQHADVRDRDEREGRARRQLTDAAAVVRAQTDLSHYRSASGDDSFVVTVTAFHARREITETGADLVECLDRARDRLNREEWDQ